MTGPTLDARELASPLTVLGSEVRMAIVEQLRSPKILTEIEVSSSRSDRDKPLARQTVKEHLERLKEAGFVVSRQAERDHGTTTEYLLDHRSFYALGEHLSRLSEPAPADEPGGSTRHRRSARSGEPVEGPALVLVKGAEPGTSWRLGPKQGPTWTIGRRREADISMHFDPFVSADNSRIRHREGTFTVEDLPTSRNGTHLNFTPIDEGAEHELADGDLVAVGASVLVYRA